jgi:hypothetical protein
MLSHTVWKVADTSLSDQDHNAFIESFAIHLRCLRDFLWGTRRSDHPEDAFATDFCDPGVWEEARPALPPPVRAIEGERKRIGREIAHLTYYRLEIDAETKPWDLSALLRVIVEALGRFSEVAKPERLAQRTREALALIPPDVRGVVIREPRGVTGATTAVEPIHVIKGTASFAGFTAEDVPPSPTQ